MTCDSRYKEDLNFNLSNMTCTKRNAIYNVLKLRFNFNIVQFQTLKNVTCESVHGNIIFKILIKLKYDLSNSVIFVRSKKKLEKFFFYFSSVQYF